MNLGIINESVNELKLYKKRYAIFVCRVENAAQENGEIILTVLDEKI